MLLHIPLVSYIRLNQWAVSGYQYCVDKNFPTSVAIFNSREKLLYLAALCHTADVYISYILRRLFLLDEIFLYTSRLLRHLALYKQLLTV